MISQEARVISVHEKQKISTAPCPGYRLPVPEGQSAVGSYPFSMHMLQTVPWTVLVSSTDVILRLDSCIMESKGSTTGPAVQPCLKCQNLHDHESVMGICHCAIDGAPEKTLYGYLAPSHAINAL
jgi:hypothetical protein